MFSLAGTRCVPFLLGLDLAAQALEQLKGLFLSHGRAWQDGVGSQAAGTSQGHPSGGGAFPGPWIAAPRGLS